MKFKLIIFLGIALNHFEYTEIVKAENINLNNLNCTGVLWLKNTPEIANWNIKYINITRAKLEFFYSNKKRSASLRMSIQKNGDIRAAGRWNSQTAQGSRDLTINYKNKSKIMEIGALNGMNFRAKGKCIVDKNTDILKKIKEFVFIIVEHSKYSLNHPENKDNVLRHLKHTCHAIDPSIVKERPMPASEEGLINLIKLLKNKNQSIKRLEELTKSSAERCNLTLNTGEKSAELLETTIFINSKFKKYYEENFKN